MATNTYTGTAATGLVTYDSLWANSVFSGRDGITDLVLDGSGHLRTASFKVSSARRTDGGQATKSRVTIAAGQLAPATTQIRVACRRGATNAGYTAEPYSSTNDPTSFDFVKFYRDDSFMDQLSITPINNSTTPIDIQVIFSGTVDVQCIINGQTVTSTGTGGNDHSAAAPLTGGTAGIDIFLNGTATVTDAMIDSWTDDVAAVAQPGQPWQAQGGMGVQMCM